INQAITQMDQVTQQNAALVEEAAAAAASLQDQAGSLSQVVSVFRIDGGAASAPALRGRAPAEPAARRVQPAKRVPALPRAAAAPREPASAAAGDGWETF
ncbi:methyl-accepting chemotaxis protein, partial [Variovorax sp. LT2P21]